METRNALLAGWSCMLLISDSGTEGERLATAYENVLKLVCALSELRAEPVQTA